MSSSISPQKHNHKRTKSSTATPTTPLRKPNFTHNPDTEYFPPDSITSTSPQPVISPTKAAASARLHHGLTTLTAWLESLFPNQSPLPPHLLKWRDEALSTPLPPSTSGYYAEDGLGNLVHSNPVLEALKALKQTNLSADHLRALLHQAEVSELAWLDGLRARSQQQRDDGVPARMVLDEVYASLNVSGRQALDSMARSAAMLGLEFRPDADAVGCDGNEGEDLQDVFSRRILRQAHRKLVVQEQVRELELLQKVMAGRMTADVEREPLTTLSDGSMVDEEAEHIHARTAQLNRDTKQINLKIMEYEDRVKSLERQLAGLRADSTNMQEVLAARKRVEERKASVAALQQRVAVFHGLPPDLDASREEIRRAMNELEALQRKRGGLFEKIGNG